MACVLACVSAWLLQLRLTLCDPMDHGLPGSSVHGILQARTPERVAIFLEGAPPHLHPPSPLLGGSQGRGLTPNQATVSMTVLTFKI